MISKVKDLMAVSEKLDSVSRKVDDVSKEIGVHSEGIASFTTEVTDLKDELAKLNSEVTRFSSTTNEQLDALRKARADLEKEVYDFKLIKADIKSKLVAEITEDFRSQMQKETAKLDIDVKNFNDLKQELSRLVGKFRSVEDEIAKFKAIAQDVKKADFELARHARELTKADEEKLRLLQKIDQLERLVSKMRRGRN